MLFFIFLTFLGLVYVIETQKVLDLKINLMASYVIIPKKGFYERRSDILLLDLGHLKVNTSNININGLIFIAFSFYHVLLYLKCIYSSYLFVIQFKFCG